MTSDQRDSRPGGRLAAITGGAGGIGKACARRLIAEGATVLLLDRDMEAAQAAAAKLGAAAEAISTDVTCADRVEATFAAIEARHGRLDILVNNAGIAIRKPALDLSPEDWDRVIGVNLTGSFLCARAAARLMIAQSSGAIVNVASIMGLSGGLYPNAAYQTSKGGLVNMTRALALEWAPHGIRVNAVAPTWVDTDLLAPLKRDPDFVATVMAATPLARFARPDEVAAAVAFLSGPDAGMITGHTLPVDGGFLAR